MRCPTWAIFGIQEFCLACKYARVYWNWIKSYLELDTVVHKYCTMYNEIFYKAKCNIPLISYFTLRSSLQILLSVVLDDGTSRAGDLKSGSVLSRGSIIPKQLHVVEFVHITCALKHNTRMIRLYRASSVSKDLNNANLDTLIVKLYSVMMSNRNTECE